MNQKSAHPCGLTRRHLLGALAASGVAALAGCTTPPLRTAASQPTLALPQTPAAVPAQAPASQPAVVVAAAKPPRIGLALGGGAARGFAHIGVIQALEEAGIKVDLVVGTSAGSLVAAMLAHGNTGTAMASLALTMDESTLTDWAYPGRGLLRGEALARFARQHTGGQTIEQMKLPLGVVATDLASGAGVLFQRGDVGQAVRASSAVPAVFQPVKIGDREYVDGGLVAPVPVRYARQMGATMVIAVDISTPPEAGTTGDMMKMLLQTFAIMGKSISSFELREADVVIQPPLVGVSSADFTSRLRALRSGRDAAVALMPAIKARIAALTR